jgi:DNA (cytosine-5)-methyltransferase 1
MSNKPTLRIGSLFAGIGGLELGLERAGLGRVAWQVEIDPNRRSVLAKHWPEAKRYRDVRVCAGVRASCTDEQALDQVEVICGGFPCQDLSDASRGRGGGIEGSKSGLWREYVRIVEEIEPAIVVVENVAGAAARKWLPSVRGALHVLGYRTRALRVDARDVGAPHARARVFVIGYADAQTQPVGAIDAEMARVRSFTDLARHWWEPVTGRLRVANGFPERMDIARLEMLGDSVVPQCAELVGRVIVHDIMKAATLAPARELTKASAL